VPSLYTVVFGGLLLAGGRAGDAWGRRRVLLAGIAVFTVASLLGGFATTSGGCSPRGRFRAWARRWPGRARFR
jgi:MFS family permease